MENTWGPVQTLGGSQPRYIQAKPKVSPKGLNNSGHPNRKPWHLSFEPYLGLIQLCLTDTGRRERRKEQNPRNKREMKVQYKTWEWG
jgi:hypothetical protein